MNTSRFAPHPDFYIEREYIGCLLIRLSADHSQIVRMQRENLLEMCLSTACPTNLYTDKQRRNFSGKEEVCIILRIYYAIISFSREMRLSQNSFFFLRATYTPDLKNPAFFISRIITPGVIYRNDAAFLRWDEALISIAILLPFFFCVLSIFRPICSLLIASRFKYVLSTSKYLCEREYLFMN